MSRPILELKRWEVYAGKKRIVGPIDLRINRGEVHFLLGHNGSGKTTLALSILGKPDLTSRGEIYIKGVDARTLGTKERTDLGIYLAFQILPDLKGLKVKDLAVDKKLLEEFGINDSFLEKEISKLSGGERKILEIIQIPKRKPDLIILDEPDSGVDSEKLEKIKEFLQNYYCQERPAFLIITHRKELLGLFPWATIHKMKDGRIVESYTLSQKEVETNGRC